jgi:hypothetical protein
MDGIHPYKPILDSLGTISAEKKEKGKNDERS